MPVRSLHSSVLKWPDRETVVAALRQWTARVVAGRSDVLRLGFFGSYSRGDWGVGSDLDLVVVVSAADVPFNQRPSDWDRSNLPVPTDILVYTAVEWRQVVARGDRFARVMSTEVTWVHP